MAVTATMVKKLRDQTGAGMMDCKKALQQSGGDFEKAVDHLRKMGIATAAQKSGRTTKEGLITSYIHAGNRLGVLLEVSCETDFVARTEAFQTFAKDIAMQVAACNPLVVKREDLPLDLVEREKGIYGTQARNEGKPEHIIERISEGRLQKYYQEVCLLEQAFVKDAEKSVNDVLTEMVAKTGENITIKRFARFRLGEEK